MIKVITVTAVPRTVLGGIEEYAYSVINELRTLGFQVYVITSKGKYLKSLTQEHDKSDRETLSIDSYMIFQRPVPTIRGLFSLAKSVPLILNSDIVHIHMPYPLVESYVSLISKFARKKLVVTYHMDAKIDTDQNRQFKFLRYLFIGLVEKACYLLSSKFPLSLADVVCTNTMAYATGSPITSKYLDKVRVIYQGIKQQLYQSMDNKRAAQIREKYLGEQYRFLVSFVGRLVPYKGVDYLLDAIRIINENSQIKIRFVIGGKGPQKSKLVKQVQSLDLKNVTFLGFVEDTDLCNLFRASDVVVSPSISALESTPISLLCSLMSGTPVVGTSVGGTEETIPNGPYARIVPSRDANALANAITDLVQCVDGKSIPEKTPLIMNRYWSHVAKDYGFLFTQLQLDIKNAKEEKLTTGK